jgi:hypothetical protein
VQLVEGEVVDHSLRAVEFAGQFPAVPEEPKDTGELPLSAEPPGLVGKEDLAHPRKIHRGVHVVGLLGPS